MEKEPDIQENADRKAARAFRTISEVATEMNVPAHVLRFWEKKFPEVDPVQRSGGGRRYYRPEDVALLKKIDFLLHEEGYTIKGVQKLLKEGTINSVVAEMHSSDRAEDRAAPQVENTAELDSIITELEEISGLLKKVI